jgi:hypothetical protein
MTDFRGVQKEALIDSIDRAVDFLRGLDLGSNTGAALDLLRENDIPAKIAQAGNDEELANTMRDTGALPYLSQFHDIFAYHAAAEADGGKSHEAQDLYRDLMAWSAFFDETVKPDLTIQKEIHSHLVFRALDRLAEADTDIQEAGDARLSAAVLEIAKKDKNLAGWLEENAPVYRLLYGGEPSPELTDLMAASTPSQDACLQKALYAMSGLPPLDEVPAAPKAMDSYNITLSNQEGALPEARWMAHVQSVRKKMLMAMLPFARTAQTAHIEIRPLTAEKDKWSFSFYGTRRAAQTAALALKSFNYNVVDAQGQTVEPLPPPRALPPPPSGPAPGPP